MLLQVRRRRAVTLLEVLFSIGIVAVGLLGVLIIVPLAGRRSAEGVRADGADRLGRNAIRLFDAQQMRRSASWTQWDSTNNKYVAFTGGEAFCIDPLYMATNGSQTGFFRFPYSSAAPAPSIPVMKRISLRTTPGSGAAMSLSQAERVFKGGDDLVFGFPDDRTLPAVQKFDADDNASQTLKRQSDGAFSWMATLVPQQASATDLCLLSIVVFHRRNLEVYDIERRVEATPVPVNLKIGFNGGDVLLSSTLEDDLKMKEGEWLMLAGIQNVTINGTTQPQNHFQWYRIQNVDAGPVANAAGTGYQRDLTLFGRDWQFSEMTKSVKTYAIWIPGIVAVYEKEIRLETSSLWTNR